MLNQENNNKFSFYPYFAIVRPRNSLLSGIGVILGTITSEGTSGIDYVAPLFQENIITLIIAYIATVMIAAGGYTINDYYDCEIDKINRPDRIIPSGKLTPAQALRWSYILFIGGFISAVLLFDPIALLLAILGVISLISYGKIFKRKKEMGNIVVSVLSIIPFLYGGVITNAYFGPFYLSVFLFSLSMGREILKDVEDLEGDKNDETLSSLPIRFGIKKTVFIANIYLFILIVFTWLPVYVNFFKSLFYVVGFIILDMSLIYVMWKTLRGDDTNINEMSRIGRKILKLDYFLGAIIFLIDPIFPFTL